MNVSMQKVLSRKFLLLIGICFLIMRLDSAYIEEIVGLDEQLLAAVETSDVALAHKLLQEGANINYTDTLGDSLLIIASCYGDLEMVEMLLEAEDIEVNAVDRGGRTALIDSSLYGDKEIIKIILKAKGINVNAADNQRETALIVACHKGHVDVVEILINAGEIDVNAANISSETALMVASFYGHKEIVEILLKVKDIAVNAVDADGRTAVMWASCNEHKEVVELLESFQKSRRLREINESTTDLYRDIESGNMIAEDHLPEEPITTDFSWCTIM